MSKLCPTQLRPLALSAALLCAPALAGCAAVQTHAPLLLPPSLSGPCAPAVVGLLGTQGDLDALVVRQEGALAACNRSKAIVEELVAQHNELYTVKPKWKFW